MKKKETEISFPDLRALILKGMTDGSGIMAHGKCAVLILFFWFAALLGLVSGCKPKDAMPSQGPEVAVVTLQTERLAITNTLPGRTSAFLIAEIRPQVNGIVQKRFFTEGSDVKAGEELYQIDPAPFQAALERAEANLEALRARVSRYKEALEDKAVSQQAFDDANAALKQAKAELKVARINLDYTRIVSPINGRIGTSTVTEGGIVTAYQPVALATVQQMDPIYVNVPQSANDLLRFQRSFKNGILNRDETQKSTVSLILGDGTPYALQGTLQFKDVTVDPTTGSVILRTVFPNPENILLPGMFVRAIITEGVMEQAILVPQQCVAQTPKGESVALVVGAGEKVEQRMLTLDRAVGDKWLVTSGLQLGDRVIVEGVQRARPGAVVKAVPFEAGQKNDLLHGKNVSPPQ